MRPDLAAVSLDGVLSQLVRDAVRDELRVQLAPLIERMDVVVAAAPPALVDVETAAERLGLSPATVRRQLASGDLPGVRTGRRWRVDLAAIGRPSRPEKVIAELAAEARR